MPVRKFLQATVHRFLCAAVNIRFMMVRPNKTKPESYMRSPTVSGGRRQYTHARKAQTSRVRIPAGPPFLFFYGVLTQTGGVGWFYVVVWCYYWL
jgi:hypothetical protein